MDHWVTILVNSAGLHSLRKIKKSSHISAKLFERAALDVLAMIWVEVFKFEVELDILSEIFFDLELHGAARACFDTMVVSIRLVIHHRIWIKPRLVLVENDAQREESDRSKDEEETQHHEIRHTYTAS